MSTTASDHLDLAALKAAIESRDPARIAGFYAPDATVVMVDQEHPPSRPHRLEGIEEIRAMLDDVFTRDMTHEMTHAVVGAGGAAYTIACRYSDGMRVEVATVLDVRDGRIVHEEGVQAWDAAG